MRVKVLFDVEGFDSVEIESLWAVATDDGYRLDNIPFYVRGYAFGDVISATPDDGGLLRCTGLVRASGHSTIRILCPDPDHATKVRAGLLAMGCDFETDTPALIAVDIPPAIALDRIRAYLDEKVRIGEVDEYEEGCLAQG